MTPNGKIVGTFSAQGGAMRLNYDAAKGSPRRRQLRVDNRSEDRILRSVGRDKITSDTRALRRNAAEVGWMIRRHLDYVSTFNFKCSSRDPVVNEQVTKLMTWWSRPWNFDASGRFGLKKFVRLAEASRTVDGDCLIYKINTGKVQLIEGDRNRTPGDLGVYAGTYKPEDFVHGVIVDDALKPLKYAICDRGAGTGRGYKLRQIILGKYCFQHAYRDRYDQVRGVSPLAAAVNQFCDLYESREYALAKMKLSQLFALKLKRAALGIGADGEDGDPDPYKFDFGSGPQLLDLDEGDDAEFLESATPSTQFQAFFQTGIQIGLKALDIPYSFYAENYTNYSGARQALLQYEQSADDKRSDNQELLNNLTAWRLQMFIDDGELTLPAGWTLDDVVWEWLPAGLPWIDPLKEAQADVLMVDNFMASRGQLAKWRGEDWQRTIRERAEEDKVLRELGYDPIGKGGIAPPTSGPEETSTPNKSGDDNADQTSA